GGAAWYLAGGPDPRLAVLAFAVASLAHLVSYQRSRAESLGLVGNGGLAERAERMVVLGLGLAFDALVFSLWLLLVLTSITVVQRFVAVWNQVPSPARAEQAAERRAPWWLTPRAPDADESRLVRWRSALAPPGERRERPRRDTSAAGPLTRWLASARPSRTGTPRWYRWRFGAAGSGVEERTEARRRWRGRNRP
ncbi:MAG: hypothetical protein ACRDY7_12160, partial [Acidimicrobiia bacterium]